MTGPSVLFVHAGGPRHGVARFGRVLAGATAPLTTTHDHELTAGDLAAGELTTGDPAGDLAGAVAAGDLAAVDLAADDLAGAVRRHRPDVVHLQFTDLLYGSPAGAAADRFGALLGGAVGAHTVVTLHDLPPTCGGGTLEGGRRAAYARVAGAADAVVVCSRHEAQRLSAWSSVTAEVIPHFVEPGPPAASRPTHPPTTGTTPRPRTVGILGHLYPGKGHEDLVAACAEVGPAVSLVAIGGPAPRHEELADGLRRAGEGVGIPVVVTGWVDDDALLRWVLEVAVPVVANRSTSASGSLATWLSAGRRPLVRAGDYTREVASLAPGCLTLYDPDDPGALPRAMEAVLAEPALTWQPGVPDLLRPQAVARRHLAWYRRLV